jgi:hypothetical protein
MPPIDARMAPKGSILNQLTWEFTPKVIGFASAVISPQTSQESRKQGEKTIHGPIARTICLALMAALSLVGRPSDASAADVVPTLRHFDRTGATVATTDDTMTMPQLEALGLAEVVTSTPWT